MQTCTRLLVLALLGLLTGCGGASAFDQDRDPDALQGDWYGVLDADVAAAGGFQEISFRVNRSGKWVDIVIAGSSTGSTATPIGTSNGLREYVFNDLDEMSVYVHTDATRLAFFIDDTRVGIVQRGTGPLPAPFEDDDIDGTYIGTEYALDGIFDVVSARPSRALAATATAPLTFNTQLDVAPNCTADGTLTGIEPSFGVFDNGTFADTTVPSDPGCLADGEQRIYVSADANLLLSVACTPNFTGTVPTGCRFSFFER